MPRLRDSLLLTSILPIQSMLHRPLKNSPANFGAASPLCCCCLGTSGDSNSPFEASPKIGSSFNGSHELTLGSPVDEAAEPSSPTFYRQHHSSQLAGLLQTGTAARGSGRSLPPPQPQPQQARTMMGVAGRRNDMVSTKEESTI